jgi:ABC-type transport system involved in multi-copper enzyme maturation permease subunit
MNVILTIAKNTFKETVRDRLFYAILILALLFIAGSLLFGSLSLGQDVKIVTDFGLAGVYLFSILIAIFLGTNLIHKELEQRTAYIILSKAVTRTQFVIGKFLGLCETLLVANIIMSAVYLPIVWYLGGFFPKIALLAIGFQYLETVVFIALTVLFSTFAAPIASAIYAIMVFIIGHSLGMLPDLAKRAGAVVKNLELALYYLFPNLDKFNIRIEASHNLAVPPYLIAFTVLYGLIFVALFIMLAALSLKQQDI